ncbi:MAG: hypothetical protein KF745_15100 [Phycisphaeraceae bacterium]|nr:hypothetical protein [Phycisphaeraceae bacterium]
MERTLALARRRQIYLVKSASAMSGSAPAGAGTLVPLGELSGLIESLRPFNTAPDGSGPAGCGDSIGVAVLHGPGFTIEMPTGTDEVNQAIVSLQDEDFAWAVLGKACKSLGWRMMDPDSGRTFG